MTEKVRVDVEEVLKLKARLREINKIPLQDVQWYENGQALDIPQEVVEDFRFTGLSNGCFIDCEAYKQKASR